MTLIFCTLLFANRILDFFSGSQTNQCFQNKNNGCRLTEQLSLKALINAVIKALRLLKTFKQVKKQFYGVFRPYLKMSLPNVTALQANGDKIALFCQFYNVVAIFQFLHFSSGHHRTELTSPCKEK